MFITEAKLRDIIKQVVVDTQLIEEDKSIMPVPTVPPKGWTGGFQPTAKIDINFDPLWYDMHPDKIRAIVGTYPEYAGKSYEELDQDINSILFGATKEEQKVTESYTFENWLALTVENRKLRKELEDAKKVIAQKTETIYNLEVDQDVQDEKLAELEGLLTRAQVVLEGLTSGDYFE